MVSVGIDISKEKSTVCILKPYSEIVSKPFEVNHVEKELSQLSTLLLRPNDEVQIVMMATGIYHLPVLSYLQEKEFFVAVVNAFEMKAYHCEGLRRINIDKQDAIAISNYGIVHWYRLKNYEANGRIYEELKLLGRQYRQYENARGKCIATNSHARLYNAWNKKSVEGLE